MGNPGWAEGREQGHPPNGIGRSSHFGDDQVAGYASDDHWRFPHRRLSCAP
jgi:hypothetical protein